MKNKEILRKIYYENRAINRNIQRLANISLIGLLARSAKKVKESDDDDEQGKNLAKAGLLLVVISEALIMISDILDHRKMKIEEKIEKCE